MAEHKDAQTFYGNFSILWSYCNVITLRIPTTNLFINVVPVFKLIIIQIQGTKKRHDYKAFTKLFKSLVKQIQILFFSKIVSSPNLRAYMRYKGPQLNNFL